MRTILFILAFIALGTGGLFAQGGGPLTPSGAPAPTMKTLQEVEPRTPLVFGAADTAAVTTSDANYHFIIDQPGSYYLIGNLRVSKPNGIDIRAAGVTLDLGGFEIRRTSGAGGNGVEVDPASARCTVRNGTLSGFEYGLNCIFAFFSSRAGSASQLAAGNCSAVGIQTGDGWEITGCEAHQNGGGGIVGGRGSTITNCSAYLNTGGAGITAGTGSAFTGCTGHSNVGDGIVAGTGSTITGCAGYSNDGVGITAGTDSTVSNCAAFSNGNGFYGLQGSTFTNCTASLNDSTGFTILSGSTVTGCTARANVANGIHGNFGATTITGCTAHSNGGTGIVGSTITGCTAESNGSYGIVTFPGTITGCAAVSNGNAGIFAGNGSAITSCTATLNTSDGILASDNCLIRANACDGNGNGGNGAGIHTNGEDNRIQDNQVTNNDRGIDVDSAGSLIIQNSASGNTTNYSIAGSNRYGPIIDISAAGAAAVNGSSAADTTTTTHPWANFSY